MKTNKIMTPKEEQKKHLIDMMKDDEELGLYEEPKQETLEEAKKRIANDSKHSGIKLDYQDGIFYGIEEGAKWQQERMYSDMQEYAEFCIRCYEKGMPCIIAKDWFEQFKKK